MKLPKAELLVYALVAAGTVVALSQGVSRGVILGAAIVIALLYACFEYRRSRRESDLILQREEPPPEPRAPWRDPLRLIVPVMVVVLAATLHFVGSPLSVIGVLSALFLGIYAYTFALAVERFRDLTTPGRQRRVSVEDWGLLAISLAFCLGAAAIWRNDRPVAIQTFAIFGGCTLVFIAIIRRKLRADRFKPTVVRITGSVDIPMKQGRLIAVAVGCSIVGVAIAFADPRDPLFYRALGGFIALVGATLLVLLATGVYRRQFIRFEPDGIVVGEATYRYRIPWDSVTAVAPFEYASNPFIGLGIDDVDRLEVTPPKRRRRLERKVRSNLKWFGTSILLAPLSYGMETTLLAAALARYVEFSEFRSELGPLNARRAEPLLPAR